MTTTLRQLLIQRAARLQERPALTTAAWGSLSWSAWRNRVEGLALGLLAAPRPVGTAIHALGHGPWDWAAEVAAACCGLRWEEGGEPVPEEVLGGGLFNSEEGRGPYHAREREVLPSTPFTAGLAQADLLERLQRWNRQLGWDHTTSLPLDAERIASPEGRAALWCALYAGAHVQFSAGPTAQTSGFRGWFSKSPVEPLDFEEFRTFWLE